MKLYGLYLDVPVDTYGSHHSFEINTEGDSLDQLINNSVLTLVDAHGTAIKSYPYSTCVSDIKERINKLIKFNFDLSSRQSYAIEELEEAHAQYWTSIVSGIDSFNPYY